jgi:hypothetical protein
VIAEIINAATAGCESWTINAFELRGRSGSIERQHGTEVIHSRGERDNRTSMLLLG